VQAFGAHLGPVFIQFNDRFGPKRKGELFTYLRSLPQGMQYFLELRHPAWFGVSENWEETTQVLRSLNMGAIITDTAGRRDCCHMSLTVPKTFVRFVGNSLHRSDFMRIDQWIQRLGFWLKNGLEEGYFFMHMPDEIFTPELTVYLVEKLQEAFGLPLIRPRFLKSPGAAEGKPRSAFHR
jgi:uncharacterized protein YecE (DUF72 family)